MAEARPCPRRSSAAWDSLVAGPRRGKRAEPGEGEGREGRSPWTRPLVPNRHSRRRFAVISKR